MSRASKLICLAALACAACTPRVKDVTVLRGELPSGLDEVEIHGAALDTLLKGEDGRFEIEIPTNPCTLVRLVSGPAQLALVPDGTVLEIVLCDSSTVSSRTPSISLQEKLNSLLRTLALAETQESYKKEAISAINANSDNVLGAAAFQAACFLMDDAEIGQALRTLSPQARSLESVALIERLYNARMETSEGYLYRDFRVKSVSGFDYGIPVYTRVSLSDYVGQGQFVLLYFWNSRDELSLEQIPYLKEVWKKYGKKGLQIVSVAMYDTPVEAMYVADEQGMDWVALNNAEDKLLDLYGALSLPLTVYFAPDGSILNRDLLGEDIVSAADHYFSQAGK